MYDISTYLYLSLVTSYKLFHKDRTSDFIAVNISETIRFFYLTLNLVIMLVVMKCLIDIKFDQINKLSYGTTRFTLI